MGIIGNSSAVVNMVVQIPGTVADFNDVQQVHLPFISNLPVIYI